MLILFLDFPVWGHLSERRQHKTPIQAYVDCGVSKLNIYEWKKIRIWLTFASSSLAILKPSVWGSNSTSTDAFSTGSHWPLPLKDPLWKEKGGNARETDKEGEKNGGWCNFNFFGWRDEAEITFSGILRPKSQKSTSSTNGFNYDAQYQWRVPTYGNFQRELPTKIECKDLIFLQRETC